MRRWLAACAVSVVLGGVVGARIPLASYESLTGCFEDEIALWTGEGHECTPRDNYDEALLDGFVDRWGQPVGIAPAGALQAELERRGTR